MKLKDPFIVKQRYLKCAYQNENFYNYIDKLGDQFNPFYADKNIIPYINAINFKFFCLGTWSSCSGHIKTDKKRTIITYIGYMRDEEEEDDFAQEFKEISIKSKFNIPYLTISFIDRNEFIYLKENLSKLASSIQNCKTYIYNADNFPNKVDLRDQILSLVQLPNHKMIITFFEMDITGTRQDFITFSIIPQIFNEKVEDSLKDEQIQTLGKQFYRFLYGFLDNLKLKRGIYLDVSTLRTCSCDYRVCFEQKKGYFENLIYEIGDKYKISKEKIIELIIKDTISKNDFYYNGQGFKINEKVIEEVLDILYNYLQKNQ